ncbi:MAG: DUF3604 domain-containing protein [Pseudomonadales bacterium]
MIKKERAQEEKRKAPLISLIGFLVTMLATVSSLATAELIPRTPCADNTATKRALFGDLHVHTSFSMDAYIFDTHTGPDDAYRFAKGEWINIAPLDADGLPSKRVQLSRPLDFAAVTDHAENIGGVSLCTRKNSPAYATESCRLFREGDPSANPATFQEVVKQVTTRSSAIDTDEVCGADGRRCRDAIDLPWADTQAAAERHYDRSEGCEFTTFVAYEYSFSPEYSKVHRNIIFRNEKVLKRPLHAMHISDPMAMLSQLRAECIEGQGGLTDCDVLSIPHNPNFSDGRMFRPDYLEALNPKQEARAAQLRAQMEPVVEMMQVKGDSECSNGLPGVAGGSDEFCEFEKMRQMLNDDLPSCGDDTGAGSLMGRGCLARNDFVRYALVYGLQERQRIGVNPFQFGLAASTDQHDGTMGNTEESAYADPERNAAGVTNNPGGLFGVWAEANDRDSIFDSIRAKEVFGTSGTRIKPRFFAGWDMPENLCESNKAIESAYKLAVPMGSELPARPQHTMSPQFFATAQADPEGANLERIQIIKGWVGENGDFEQRVYNVAGGPVPGEPFNTSSCEPLRRGHGALCAVWQDPEFDTEQDAVYYSRVVEMPSCRWSTMRCNALAPDKRPGWCEDPSLPAVVQERAWTSPVWYQP